MIIKSMSRKVSSFGQLVAYVSRDAADRRFELRHNVLSNDTAALTAEFEDNGRLLQKRKNGVVMYHEIISITRGTKLMPDAQKEVLRSIALDYIKARAPQSLVYGQLHDDHKDHLHYHLVMSANALGDSKRHRLSKQEFRQIQVELEARVLQQHPNLEQALAIGKRARLRTLSQDGHELERRTGQLPKKQALRVTVEDIFTAAQNPQDLFNCLTNAGFELYRRGKSVGLRDLKSGRTYRLATLGVGEAFNSMSRRFEMTKTQNRNVYQQVPNPDRYDKQLIPSGGLSTNPIGGTEHDAPHAKALTAEMLPNVVGAVAKESTSLIEIAVHQAGGPKPFERAEDKAKNDAKVAAEQTRKDCVNVRVQKGADQVVQGETQMKLDALSEQIVEQRKAEMAELRAEQAKHQNTDSYRLKR